MILLGGCLGGPAAPLPTPESPCTAAPPMPEPDADAAEHANYPERPSEATARTVREYVREFEAAYVHNDALVEHGNVTSVSVGVVVEDVTRRDAGFVVRLESSADGVFIEESGGERQRVAWSTEPWTVSYVFLDDGLFRTESETLRDATTVACF